jgi:hypothetical protein
MAVVVVLVQGFCVGAVAEDGCHDALSCFREI